MLKTYKLKWTQNVKSDLLNIVDYIKRDSPSIAKNVYHFGEMPPFNIPDIYFRFIELLQDRFLPERRLGRLKQFTHYYSSNFRFGHHLATGVQNCKTLEEAAETAMIFFNKTREPKS